MRLEQVQSAKRLSDESKLALRTRMREALKKITPEQRALDSDRACRLLERQPVWQRAKRILLYAPRRDELDVAPLTERALAHGKQIALPRYDALAGCYHACEVTVPLVELPAGRFGIREPGPGAPVVALNDLDLALVPGLAFDAHGRRLGRGRGFYDRLLAGFSAIKCGLGFDLQVHPQIPVEPHDILLDCILTPSRWLEVRP